MAYSTKIKGVTKESQQQIDIYLQAKSSSARTIISALRRLIIDETKKYDITDINYDDYCKYVKPYQSSQAILKREFIKYLYAFKFLKNNDGFEHEYWNPEDIRNNYEKGENNVISKKEYQVALSFEQLERIKTFLSGISELDFDNMRLDLSFYMCFYTNIDNSVLKNADTRDYKDGVWTINNVNYDIPNRYKPLLIDMQSSQRTGMNSLNIYITQLGNHVDIKGLVPKQISKSGKQFQNSCFQCGKVDYVFADRWKVINGTILCNECAEKVIMHNNVKKNYKIDEFDSYDIDILTEEEKIINEVAITPFDNLDNKFNKRFNYLKINEFLLYIGKRGEKFAYEYEKNKHRNSIYYDQIDPTPSKYHEKGYDIYSFEDDGTPIMIEVKTTTGDVEDAFEMTSNELAVAQDAWNHKRQYKIYRIGNILSKNPKMIIYENISKDDFDISGIVYKIKRI